MEDNLLSNAKKALIQMLEPRTGEHFLVVTDEATRPVASAFEAAGTELGTHVSLYVLPEEQRPLLAMPDDLAALVADADIAVNVFRGIAQETPFRVQLIHALMGHVRRLGHGPGITEAMVREGPMSVDYSEMALRAHELIRRLRGATTIRITAPAGTDLTLAVTDRDFDTDTVIPDGKWGNFPAGEIWCAPVENGANGLVVCDGSVGDLGAVPTLVKLTVEAGRVTEVLCASPEFEKRIEEVLQVDDEASVIGEFGIGLNAGARITGNLLEDEKAFRTCHVAFGNNEDMPGGQNRSATHRDFLVRDPTVMVTFQDGRTERLLAKGEVVTEERTRPQAPAYRNVIVAVDFSEASRTALEVGDRLARLSNASFSVCHVITRAVAMNPLFPHLAAVPDATQAHREEEQAMEQMDDLVAEVTHRLASEYEAIILVGQPAEEIVRLAVEKKADLVVLASRGMSGIEGMLLGSVAESVARNAHCQVLVAR